MQVASPTSPGAPTTSDADAIAASIERPARFDEVFARHATAIFQFVAARVGPARAEDVTSSTFATAFAIRERFDPSADSARPWLYGIAANKLRQHADDERRWLEQSRAGATIGLEVETDLTHDRLDAQRLAPQMAAALAQLSPSERDVLLLYVFAEMSQDQIAAALGIRRNAVKTRLSRGRARLRAALEDFLIEAPARGAGT
ncbi:MAG: polymerase, sigma-24 subunit, subfamily [Thermoleophilia bacterium]|nr:polymerase, sigma-24 subunit, subfamily [Thermoleophilia bacterium]